MLDFVTNNLESILAICGAVIALGVAIAAITPTKKDDAFWTKVKSLFAKAEPVVKTYAEKQKENKKK